MEGLLSASATDGLLSSTCVFIPVGGKQGNSLRNFNVRSIVRKPLQKHSQ